MLVEVDVIIPVYNEIKSLDRCIESVLAQNYADYRIIIVDDGSNDGSEIKCDEYAEKYENITVIHQTNKGLGAARNVGVIASNAEYILFVDADDYIHRCMLSLLVSMVLNKNADMATMKLAAIPDEYVGTSEEESISEKDIIIMKTQDALEDMCYMKHFGFSACSKLIKRDYLIRYPFPEGIIYEDTAIMYKIVSECNRIVHINKIGYYYTQTLGKGITRGKYQDNYIDGIAVAEELRSYLEKRYPMIVSAGQFRIAYSAYSITKTLTGGTAEERANYKHVKSVLCKAYYKEGVFRDPKVNTKRRIQIGMATLGYIPMVISWKLYYMLIRIRKM
ncbi:glycosyltransferase family 2 protein [Butyrivibrio sp. AD3002]|uniref:glycosyltransferase family 2 protein n=1 Tax=Butyrivibrio sp. AD3002 TaxID=1280670 RepID=UPI0003B3DBC3|nr:glycosyltransferase family 2 protein [Butyrivibrio sp. AD3002]